MQTINQVEKESPELDNIRELFREYEKELDADLCFQNFQEELENPLIKYGPPKGTLLLAYFNDEPAACIALTPMLQPGYCEMKRLYVRPNYRQYGLGRTLAKQLIEFATGEGYHFMRLDTFKKLESAIRLYETLDFYYIDAYYHNPYSEVVYMEKRL